MKPTIGRIVHYYEDNLGPFAAIITGVNEFSDSEGSAVVDLYVFPCKKKKLGDAPIDTLQSDVTDRGTRRWAWPLAVSPGGP
jgi:hypothetical protein